MNDLLLKSVLLKTLRDRRKALIWWSAGTVLYLLFLGGFYPSIAEMEEDLSALISNYPEALMAMPLIAGSRRARSIRAKSSTRV